MQRYDDPATLSAVYSSAAKYDIPISVYNALIYSESSYNPNAKNPSGALGIAQFMPGTAKEKGVDPLNKLQSLDAGAKYLKQIYDSYGDGDWMKSIAYYKGYGTGGGVSSEELAKVTALMKQKFNEMSTIPGVEQPGQDAGLFARTFHLANQLLDIGSVSESAGQAMDKVDEFLSQKSFFEDPIGYLKDWAGAAGASIIFVVLALVILSAGVNGLVKQGRAA